jgi:phage tail sheath protein FI
MKAICESRRDCRAILDTPFSELAMSPTTDLTDWRNTVQNFNTYFTSLDAPWIRIADNINGGVQLDIPTSGFTAQIMARKDNVREPWNAAAGTQLTGNIGVISSSYFSILGLSVNYSSTQQGLLYKSNINPYRNKPGIGIVRWGQKTQQTKASALDRENVVTLSIIIENSVKVYLDNVVFELNTKTVRLDVSETIKLFMDNIQARGGVYACSVICDETNNTPTVIDNNELIVDIIYQPVKTAEFIRLRGTITKTGASLSVA